MYGAVDLMVVGQFASSADVSAVSTGSQMMLTLTNLVSSFGTYAATGMGKQSPIIIAVTDKTLRDKLSKLNADIMGVDIDPFYGAPELLIVLANKKMPTYIYDGSLVMGNMMNAAADLGVANCWIHRAKEEFESEKGKEILKNLGIEGDYEGIGHLILGYAAKPDVSLSHLTLTTLFLNCLNKDR